MIETELQNRMFVASPRDRRRALLVLTALVALTLILALAAVMLIVPDDPSRRERLLRKSIEVFAHKKANVAALILFVAAFLAQLAYVARARRLERLIVDESGIRYRSPLPAGLQAVQPGWSLAWSAIGKASLRRSRLVRGPLAVELVLAPAGGGPERVLRPHQWVDPRDMQAPLVGLVEKHVAHFESNQEPPGFALERHPRTLAAITLIFALLAYAIADPLLGTETYAASPPLGINLVAGFVAALLAWRWLQAGAVPAPESAGVALLIGCVLVGALYPGLLRVNQLTDRDGLAAHPYALAPDLSLRPLERELPVLRFPRFADYWSHFPPGSLHEFRLRRGGLGFWQVDMAPVNEAMRAWYASRR